MITSIFYTVFHQPLYNALVFLISIIPGGDVGLAIIVLTILVRVVLLPIFTQTIVIQRKMKMIEPELRKIKEKFKDRQEQAQKVMELYRERGINPLSMLSGIFISLIQIPVFIALYFIFLRGGLPEINVAELYAFISAPGSVDMIFLGILDVSEKSMVLAALAGITQYFQIKLSPLGEVKPKSDKPSMKEDFARSWSLQMRYGLPILIVVISYLFSAAVALYWTTSNIFAIGQELVVRRRMEQKAEQKMAGKTGSAAKEANKKTHA